MRAIFIAVLACLTSSASSAQNTTVRVTSLSLSRVHEGWAVSFPSGSAGKYSLQNGDVLLQIDLRNAREIGPLSLAAEFSAAFDRAVPITVLRQKAKLDLFIWRGDGAAPAMKPGVVPDGSVSRADRAPTFSLPSLDGPSVNLASLRGKWVLVSFWATWCTPCLQEAQVLNQLAREHEPRLKVLAIAVNDQREKLNAFAAKIHPAYTILDGGPLQAQPALSFGAGNINGGGSVPLNVLIRPDGTVAYVEGGFEAPSPLEKEVSAFVSGTTGGGE